MSKIIITILCILIFVKNVKAQDANYWSSSYNPAGFLTPGAVIAFNRDSGVMFLNPALLAYNNKNSASINASIYQYGSIKIKNGAGTGLDLKSTSASIIPQMVSAIISFKGKSPFTIGYALTHDPVMSYNANQQRDARFNVLNDSYSPGDEYYLGQYKNLNSINETSGIISGGFKVSDSFALGISAEGQFRKQTYNSDFSSRAIFNVPTTLGLPPIANAEESYLANYYNVGIMFKGGFAYDAGRNHLGLTISSPLLHIKGSASLLSDDEANNIIGGPDTLNLLANTRQTKLKANYKMPLSIAFGYALDFKEGQIYFATEYFGKVDEYDVITPRDDENYVKGSDIPLDASSYIKLKDARRSVANFGFGVSYLLKPDVTGFLSFLTDFNYADNSLYKGDNGFTGNTAYYNLYHCQVGANIKKRKFNFRAGLLLSYGSTNKYMQYINFDDPNENNALAGDPINTHASHFDVGLMLSYIHNL